MPLQRKQMRHWSLTRMLHWPCLSPWSCSNRFLGGTRRVSTFVAAAIMSSLRNATRATAANRRLSPISYSCWVSLHLNDEIMRVVYYALRNMSSGMLLEYPHFWEIGRADRMHRPLLKELQWLSNGLRYRYATCSAHFNLGHVAFLRCCSWRKRPPDLLCRRQTLNMNIEECRRRGCMAWNARRNVSGAFCQPSEFHFTR